MESIMSESTLSKRPQTKIIIPKTQDELSKVSRIIIFENGEIIFNGSYDDFIFNCPNF